MTNLCKHRAGHSRSCCGGGDVTRSVEALRGLERLNLECTFEVTCMNTSDRLGNLQESYSSEVQTGPDRFTLLR